MNGKAYAGWLTAGLDLWMLGAEAASVMALRTARIAAGGPAGAAEAELMVTEKGPRRDRATDPRHDRHAGYDAARRHQSFGETLSAQGRRQPKAAMLLLALKAAISGILIAVASTLAKRYPGLGALIASLPLVSVLGMIWLWNEKSDAANMIRPALAADVPSDSGPPPPRHRFWPALLAGCALTIMLYAAMTG